MGEIIIIKVKRLKGENDRLELFSRMNVPKPLVFIKARVKIFSKMKMFVLYLFPNKSRFSR